MTFRDQNDLIVCLIAENNEEYHHSEMKQALQVVESLLALPVLPLDRLFDPVFLDYCVSSCFFTLDQVMECLDFVDSLSDLQLQAFAVLEEI